MRKSDPRWTIEIQALLRQQDRNVQLLADLFDRLVDLLNDRGLNSLRRLLEDKRLGLCDQRPPDGKLLLFSSAEHSALALSQAHQHWNLLSQANVEQLPTGKWR